MFSLSQLLLSPSNLVENEGPEHVVSQQQDTPVNIPSINCTHPFTDTDLTIATVDLANIFFAQFAGVFIKR